MIATINPQKNEVEFGKLMALKSLGVMMSNVCSSQEESLKYYANNVLEKKIGCQTTEFLNKYNTAFVLSKTIFKLDVESDADTPTSFDDGLGMTERVHALSLKPKFIQSIESSKSTLFI